MRHRWISNDGNSRLLLIFLGWGADGKMLEGVTKAGYDILAVWDYRDEAFPSHLVADYAEVCVLAWSFGVMEANRIAASFGNLSRCVAVNGTNSPIDDRNGIPVAIFDGTLANLDIRNLRKFYRRMCVDAHVWAEFQKSMPDRPLDELIDELAILGHRAGQQIEPLRWAKAYVGDSDAIIPTRNQLDSWHDLGVDIVTMAATGHLPDWQSVIDSAVVDKELVAQRFEQAASTYDHEAQMQKSVASALWELTLRHVTLDIDSQVLEVGCGTGLLTRQIIECLHPENLQLWDIAMRPDGIDAVRFSRCDAELAIKSVRPASFDLIISASTLQWFNSPSTFIADAVKILRPGGVLAVSTYGPNMCGELRQAGYAVSNYPSLESLLSRLETDSATVIEAVDDTICQQFDSPRDVIRHLRSTGVNALSRRPIPTSQMRGILANYPLDSDGKATLTFNPIYCIIKKL